MRAAVSCSLGQMLRWRQPPCERAEDTLSTRKTSYPLISDNLAKVVMPARLRLSWVMKTLKLFLLSVLESLEFDWQAILYALIFASAFFRQRASLGCEMVAMRSQLTFYKESIRQQRQPPPRFHPAFRLLWVLLSRVWTGW